MALKVWKIKVWWPHLVSITWHHRASHGPSSGLSSSSQKATVPLDCGPTLRVLTLPTKGPTSRHHAWVNYSFHTLQWKLIQHEFWWRHWKQQFLRHEGSTQHVSLDPQFSSLIKISRHYSFIKTDMDISWKKVEVHLNILDKALHVKNAVDFWLSWWSVNITFVPKMTLVGKFEGHRASSPCGSGDQVYILERSRLPTAATRILPPPPNLLHSSKHWADIAFVNNISIYCNVKITFSVMP